MSKALAGQVAIVTGASRGIGRGVAIGLGEAGATVYVTGRTMAQGQAALPGTLPETAAQVTAAGGMGIAVTCDHRIDADVNAVFALVERDHGRLDILVNNAAALPEFHLLFGSSRFWELAPSVWDDMFEVGLRSHFIAAQLAAPLMIASHSGLIVNISSSGAQRRFAVLPYGVAKAALDRMTVDMAEELREYGLAVISLWPPPTSTENMLASADETDDPSSWSVPEFTGRVIAALAVHPEIMEMSGHALVARTVATELRVQDDRFKQPD